MVFRMITVATMSIATFMGAAGLNANEPNPAPHDGKLVRITKDLLVMTSKAGDEHSHALMTTAEFTLDGKACKATELKPGARIRVTLQGGAKGKASRVEALDKNRDFASHHHDGKVVSVTGNKLVMSDLQGKSEQTCVLSTNVKITCDGIACKSSDLKAGFRIRVTTESDKPHEAIRIEAIDKNADFVTGG